MTDENRLTIAIDGYSSCGKSTMAKSLARKLHYNYVDSGAMYRAVTLYCLDNNLNEGTNINMNALKKNIPFIKIDFRINSSTKESETWLNDQNVETKIRGIDVSNLVSPVRKIAFVRKALVAQQRILGAGKGIVMDGRDIGTVVFPDADLKIFMTADVDIRAQRRYDELIEKGQRVSMPDILKNIEQRDYIDSHRDISPLRQADDAVVLDNSHLTREEQLDWILNLIKDRF